MSIPKYIYVPLNPIHDDDSEASLGSCHDKDDDGLEDQVDGIPRTITVDLDVDCLRPSRNPTNRPSTPQDNLDLSPPSFRRSISTDAVHHGHARSRWSSVVNNGNAVMTSSAVGAKQVQPPARSASDRAPRRATRRESATDLDLLEGLSDLDDLSVSSQGDRQPERLASSPPNKQWELWQSASIPLVVAETVRDRPARRPTREFEVSTRSPAA